MSNDRFGLRWGLAGGTALASIAEAREIARYAAAAKFDSFWISHAMGVDPIVTLASIANDIPDLAEVGTSVVPLYGRHPVGLAQLAMTAQSALQGRFTLGIGAASKRHAEGVLGLSWDKPFSYTRDFIDALQPLLAGQPAEMAVFQWHTAGVQALPAGAAALAESAPCPVQAFRFGRAAWGLQFHVEVTADTVGEWAGIPAYRKALEDLFGAGAVPRIEAEVAAALAGFNATARKLNDAFLAQVQGMAAAAD